MADTTSWPSARDEIEYWKTMYAAEQVAGARQAEEVMRLSAILAALREPSEAVHTAAAKAAFTASSDCDLESATPEQIDQYVEIAYVVLAAAIAAAEKEVTS